MKVTGLIAEYNPFHNGHLYHIQKSKEYTNADYLIVVMSGDYVQRGTPAIMDKYLRTQMALESGADLVLLLPVAYSCASAEYFAMGAVTLLDKLGVVDSICFGTESGNLKLLSKIASLLTTESPEFKKSLKSSLKEGNSYPCARNKAILACQDFCESSSSTYEEISNVLSEPNNILGIEYLKALFKRNSAINPITIPRIVSHYHDTALKEQFSSASAIRHLFKQSSSFPFSIKQAVPAPLFSLYQKYYGQTYPIYEDEFSLPIYYQLLKEKVPLSLTRYQDLSSDLAQRIIHELDNFHSFSSFIEHIKTKQYTQTRIARCLLHILLELETQDYASYAAFDYIPYARILGFKRDSIPLLTAIKSHSSIPVFTKMVKAEKLLNKAQRKMLLQELFSSSLYRKIQEQKFHVTLPHEYARKLLILS